MAGHRILLSVDRSTLNYEEVSRYELDVISSFQNEWQIQTCELCTLVCANQFYAEEATTYTQTLSSRFKRHL